MCDLLLGRVWQPFLLTAKLLPYSEFLHCTYARTLSLEGSRLSSGYAAILFLEFGGPLSPPENRVESIS